MSLPESANSITFGFIEIGEMISKLRSPKPKVRKASPSAVDEINAHGSHIAR